MPLIGLMLILLTVSGMSYCGSGSAAQDTSYNENYGKYAAEIDGHTYNLEYRLTRPDDSLPHPLVIMTHGRNGPHPARNTAEKTSYLEICSTLASRGYTVMLLIRRGYGNSDGPDSELKDTPYDSGMEAAKDLLSAVKYIKTNPYVDPEKIVVMGHSQGGWAAIAFSTLKDTGVLGTVILSGGTNYTDINSDSLSTRYSKWISDCGKYGANNVIPTLWIYSPNDSAIPDVASQPMFKSFQDAGGKGTFIMKPVYAPDGHFFVGTPNFFIDDILTFFNEIGFTDTM